MWPSDRGDWRSSDDQLALHLHQAMNSATTWIGATGEFDALVGGHVVRRRRRARRRMAAASTTMALAIGMTSWVALRPESTETAFSTAGSTTLRTRPSTDTTEPMVVGDTASSTEHGSDDTGSTVRGSTEHTDLTKPSRPSGPRTTRTIANGPSATATTGTKPRSTSVTNPTTSAKDNGATATTTPKASATTTAAPTTGTTRSTSGTATTATTEARNTTTPPTTGPGPTTPNTRAVATTSPAPSTTTTGAGAFHGWRVAPNPGLAQRFGEATAAVGNKFVVWGGQDEPGTQVWSDGAVYDVASNTWTAMPAPPGGFTGRAWLTAVSTGAEVAFWGGAGIGIPYATYNTGAIYNPSTNSWRTMAASPLSARSAAVGVWTGAEIIIWGGASDTGAQQLNGAAYNPSTNSWRAISTPSGPVAHARAAWTGTEMVLGAVTNGTPRAYNPSTNSWRVTANPPITVSTVRQPIWTGTELVICCDVESTLGTQLIAYNPSTNSWRVLTEITDDKVHESSTMVFGDGRLFGFADSVCIQSYVLATNTWAALPNPPTSACLRPEAFINGGLIAWSGGDKPLTSPKLGVWRP